VTICMICVDFSVRITPGLNGEDVTVRAMEGMSGSTHILQTRRRYIIIDNDSRPCKHASFNVSPASQVLTTQRTVIPRQTAKQEPRTRL